jgi:signal transduction histidine kinase
MAAAADLVVAIAFVACGAAAWFGGRAGGLTGPLMVATGAAWLAGSVSGELALLHRGPLVHLLVATPGGRLHTWPQRVLVTAGYVAAVLPAVARDAVATMALAAAVAAVAIGRWARAGGRARAVAAVASAAIGLVLVAGAVVDPAGVELVERCYEAVLVATAAALSAALLSGRSAVTDLVIDLGDLPRGGSLTSALARAVGDPSLVVGYRLADGRHVDERMRPLALPPAGAGRAVTEVEAERAAVIVHDPVALRGPGLCEGVAAAVRLALDNVRLEADICARMRDVEASRARLLRARDTEARRLERRLRAGVGRHLDVAARALGEDPERLGPELDRIRTGLGRLAAGLHPHELERGGLAVAVPAVAEGAPLPVEVTVACGRLDEAVERAAWFVCSEALANVVKHAGATRAAIAIELAPAGLVVTVEDDGRGGARPGRALAARVGAADGRLEVGDRSTGGTRLCATLPVRP